MPIIIVVLLAVVLYGLMFWYRHESVQEGQGTVHLQSEHEHFHLHVDLPNHMQIQPGDTLHILKMPELDEGRTEQGELSYDSPVRLHKASWLSRILTKSSSLLEVNELVDHP